MSTASIAQRQFGGAGTNIIKRGSQRAYRPFAIRPRPVRIMIRLCIGALMLLTSSWGADVDSDAKDDAAQDAADFDEADVVVLNKDNFDNTIQKTEYALVRCLCLLFVCSRNACAYWRTATLGILQDAADDV